jgi:hypothetical protein
MSLMLPSELATVLNLLGFQWPEADEDKLMEAAQHWRDFASEVGQIKGTASRHATQVAAENVGASVDAFNHHWQQVGSRLSEAQEAAEIVAGVLEAFAGVVIAVKGETIAQLTILAGELAATTAGAIFTFGAAEAAAPFEIAGTRLVVREILDRVIKYVEEAVFHRLGAEAKTLFMKIAKQEGGRIAKTAERDVASTATHDLERATSGRVAMASAEHDQAALRDLASFREHEGMPAAGSPEDLHTASRLDVGGLQFYGRNAHDLQITMKVNAQTATHAEAHSFQQARNAGATADRATMYVDRSLCDACGKNGGIGSLLRGTGIKEVEIVAPNGRFLIRATRPSTPIPIGTLPWAL